MNRRPVFFVSAAFAIALPLALSGCGNKGPLVLTDDPPAAPAVEAPAVEAPAEAPAPAVETAPPAADAATPPPPADGTPVH
ncbi:MAG: lipoprotein [Pseudomonadota bacterium]